MATKRRTPGDATPFLPERFSLPKLREASRDCRGCDLYLAATQTVFGEGSSRARVVFVGEQPGDSEDLQGRPFVGPAGRVFDDALAAAGVERTETYVTNAVKHFSFEPRGKARLHKRPRVGEVRACSPWLRAELAVVKPDVLVLLGAVAAQSVWGPAFRVTKERGVVKSGELAAAIIATHHPSAVLRAPDSETRKQVFDELVADLRAVKKLLGP
ncbi:MAG: uracil-DNA glycosylase [Myxococcales bacterium]|nr:MAG: uracil-DNA glycosylase [Myxococcales bacterium]